MSELHHPNTRTEHDSMGDIAVPQEHYWGAQTERCLRHFPIGEEKMPRAIIMAFAQLKRATAIANAMLQPSKMTETKKNAIVAVCEEIEKGKWDGEFPLPVWQTGSGTHTNMNCNEVIAHLVKEKYGLDIHPNDDVNMAQSSNDTFPTAMHIAAVLSLKEKLLPAMAVLKDAFLQLETRYGDVVKTARTHLQDAVPMSFSQEISGWRAMLDVAEVHIQEAMTSLSHLAIGATAVGTGLNAPKGFGKTVSAILSDAVNCSFVEAGNKFQALSSMDRMVFAHGAVKSLACDLFKIANDIRLSASGPRCGLGEITIPANEPGSSIMPGKVNPTQCEAITMIATQIMGNDVSISFAASQGQFQLNVFLPVIAYNFLQSVTLLSDGMLAFARYCVIGIVPNKNVMAHNLERSLMTVTALSPILGYEACAKCAQYALKENITLKEAVLRLGYMTEKDFDKAYHPEKMIE